MILGYLFPNKERYTMEGEYKGKFKLEKNEKVLMKDKKIKINFAAYGWGNYLSFHHIEGIGTLYKTNKRLIYDRKIDPFAKSRSWPYSKIAGMKQKRAMDLVKKGIREYFELNFNEIIGYIEDKFLWMYGLGLYVLSIDKTDMGTRKEYYDIAFSERYKIIDDPLILRNRLTKPDIKRMRKEEMEYKKSIKRLKNNDKCY